MPPQGTAKHIHKIVMLPLDDRPVNYDYPLLLAKIAGVQVMLPPRSWLGNPWRQSQHAQMVAWLKENAPSADAIIVGADTLAYGGLIPSRSAPDTFEQAVEKLSVIQELKQANPQQVIYASSVIQRVSRDNSSEEEKYYWGEYGARMFRLSYLEHKSALHEASKAEIDERDALKKQIPVEIYTDYLGIRTRNHRVNRYMLDLVQNGVIDYLLLPQDDTMEYGWNIAEARQLQMLIRRKGLTQKAITYPGGDEIGCLLLTRCICDRSAFTPRVYPRSSSSSSATLLTEYEDRPMLELLKAHLAPLGGILAETPQEADFLLYINAPAIQQGTGELQWAAQYTHDELSQLVPASLQEYVDQLFTDEYFRRTRREMQTPRRSPEEFTRSLVEQIRSGEEVAVADVAFVNGSDLILGGELLEHPEVAHLASYGGWNTAGNTLGTVIAQAVIHHIAKEEGLTPERQKAQLEFLLLRFVDDYCYQAVERSVSLLQDMPRYGLEPGEQRIEDEKIAGEIAQRIEARLQQHVKRLAELFAQAGALKAVRLSDFYLPWQRLFEIGFEINVEP